MGSPKKVTGPPAHPRALENDLSIFIVTTRSTVRSARPESKKPINNVNCVGCEALAFLPRSFRRKNFLA
jgi:hypothetical protein